MRFLLRALAAAALCAACGSDPTDARTAPSRTPREDAPTTTSADPAPPPAPGGADLVLPPAPEPAVGRLPPPPSMSAPPVTAEPPQVEVNLVAVAAAESTPVQTMRPWTLWSAEKTTLGGGPHLAGTITIAAGECAIVGPEARWRIPASGAVLESEDGLVQIGRQRYAGRLRLGPGASGRFAVTLVIDLETYLEGVLAGEMPGSFPREALRAQAIVARSYVLTQAGADGVLRVDDTGRTDQEFAGVATDPRVRATQHELVASTRGLVLRSGGRTLRAWYHSTCGGQTCPAAAVFTSPPAVAEAARATGLSGAPCTWCASSPRYRWSGMRVPGDAVVKAAGLPAAPLKGFSVVEQTLGGRATKFEVRAGTRTARVPAAALRLAVGGSVLRSTWIESASVDGKDLVVSGRGWGHGVGLCQYGAKGLAEAKHAAEAIVAHYYPGAELVRLW